MHFFLEFLNHFRASDILNMYANGAFRTSEEIKLADFAINFKVIFNDDDIDSKDLRIYNHLQRVVDAIRVHQKVNGSTHSNFEEFQRNHPEEEIHFNYFVKYAENEREVKRFNVFERRIIFSLKDIQENVNPLVWLEDALDELLSYVLRDCEEGDRVGIVVKYLNYKDLNAAFPIKLKNQLKTSILLDTLSSILNSSGTFVTGQIMIMQALRIRLPVLYRKFTSADVMKISANSAQ